MARLEELDAEQRANKGAVHAFVEGVTAFSESRANLRASLALQRRYLRSRGWLDCVTRLPTIDEIGEAIAADFKARMPAYAPGIGPLLEMYVAAHNAGDAWSRGQYLEAAGEGAEVLANVALAGLDVFSRGAAKPGTRVGESVFTVLANGKKVGRRAAIETAETVAEPPPSAAVSPYQTPVSPGVPGRPDPARSIDTSTFVAPYSGGTTAKGFPRDSQQFWEAWGRQHPDELSDTNIKLMSGVNPLTGRPQRPTAPRVDEQWIQTHPEHADYLWDVLVHHHVDGGRYAIPVPAGAHVGSGGPHHGIP